MNIWLKLKLCGGGRGLRWRWAPRRALLWGSVGAFRQPADPADNAARILVFEGRHSVYTGQLEPAGVDSLFFLFVSDPYFRIGTSRCGLSTAADLRCELAKVFLRSRFKLCGQPLTQFLCTVLFDPSRSLQHPDLQRSFCSL